MAVSGGVGFSGDGAGTTGGARTTILCRPGTSNFGDERPSSAFFAAGNPQTKTNKVNKSHGAQARKTVLESCGASVVAGAVPLSGSFQILAGCQKHSRMVTAMSDEMAATISTSHGP